MRNRERIGFITEEEYLAAEETATVRHEYVNGYIFAMSGSTDAHNLICGNLFSFMHAQLRGGPCRAYMNDMKVRIQSNQSYYYPDIMVSCEPFAPKSVFKVEPVLLIEVLSPSTKQIDLREKLMAYQKIASLKEYVVVHQDRQQIQLYRRADDACWDLQLLSKEKELVLQSLPGKNLSIPFSLIYEGYDPPSRVQEGELFYEIDPLDVMPL